MHRRVLSTILAGSLFVSSLARADDVDAQGPPAERAGGIALAVVGATTTATGALLVGLGVSDKTPDVNLEIAGAITAGFGLAASVAGVVLAVIHSKTAAQKAPDAPARTPTWHDASAGPAEVARPTLVPIFSRAF